MRIDEIRNVSRRRFFVKAIGGTVASGTVIGGLLTPTRASASAFIGATEVTQILNNIQLVLSYIKQAANLLSVINQEKMMITNLVHNGVHSFSDLSGFVSSAAGIAQGGMSIAYSAANMDLAFQKQFPGYANFDQSHPWAKNYLDWSQAHRDTISGSMRMLNLSAADLASSQALSAAIRTHASGAAGSQQMLESLGEFAGAQVNELQGLRTLMLADQQSKLAYQAQVAQKNDTEAAAITKFFSTAPRTTDTRTFDPTLGVH